MGRWRGRTRFARVGFRGMGGGGCAGERRGRVVRRGGEGSRGRLEDGRGRCGERGSGLTRGRGRRVRGATPWRPPIALCQQGGRESGRLPRRLQWAPHVGPGDCIEGVWLRRNRSVARLGVLHHCRPPHFVDTGHKAAAFSIISWRSFVVDCHSPAETLVCSFEEHPLATSRAPLPEFRRALLTFGAGRLLEGRAWVV